MRMNIDQTRHDELAASVDGPQGSLRDVRTNGRNAASRNCNVSDSIEPRRRINHASALEDQVILVRCRAKKIPTPPNQRYRRSRHKLSSIDHMDGDYVVMGDERTADSPQSHRELREEISVTSVSLC